jgi:menaquinone-9 beta-reductase
MDTFDVVVVGGRCAGAATAMLLAGSGLRVLVVDRAAEGSDTISGHMIKPDGVARLAAWGILPDLLGTAARRYPPDRSSSRAGSWTVRYCRPASRQ